MAKPQSNRGVCVCVCVCVCARACIHTHIDSHCKRNLSVLLENNWDISLALAVITLHRF